eukprot:Amastigsp_a341021_31.p3 type:complete len:228 gc:universal Amastigsp_a341021_31:705-22(-)
MSRRRLPRWQRTKQSLRRWRQRTGRTTTPLLRRSINSSSSATLSVVHTTSQKSRCAPSSAQTCSTMRFTSGTTGPWEQSIPIVWGGCRPSRSRGKRSTPRGVRPHCFSRLWRARSDSSSSSSRFTTWARRPSWSASPAALCLSSLARRRRWGKSSSGETARSTKPWSRFSRASASSRTLFANATQRSSSPTPSTTTRSALPTARWFPFGSRPLWSSGQKPASSPSAS